MRINFAINLLLANKKKCRRLKNFNIISHENNEELQIQSTKAMSCVLSGEWGVFNAGLVL